MLVQVRVLDAVVLVTMNVVVPPLPAHDQTHCEVDDQERDGGLSDLLRALGEVLAEEDDREAEDEQRRCVPETPSETEPRGRSSRAFLAARDECRHRGEMVRIGGMPEAEQDSDQGDEPE